MSMEELLGIQDL